MYFKKNCMTPNIKAQLWTVCFKYTAKYQANPVIPYNANNSQQ